MNKTFWLSVIAIFASFIGGFLLANALNRSEINSLRAENERFKNSQSETNQTSPQDISLSEDELRQKIAEADRNPNNFSFQKTLGLALYRYAAMKKDADLMAEISKILQRAHNLQAKDYDVIVALGNLYFDIGYYKKDNENFAKAREFYQKALEQKPKDVDVRTDYGLTFFLQNPPENEKAIAEFKKSLDDNPRHEKTLEYLIQTLIKSGKQDEAANYLAKLQQINPTSPSVSQLQTELANSKSDTEK